MMERGQARAVVLFGCALLAAVSLGLGLVWLLGAGSERAERLARAERALADGRLAGDEGAVALFLEVLAAEPDQEMARQGLLRAGERALKAAREAADRGERERALELLGLARAAGLSGPRIDAVHAQVRGLDHEREQLLAEAAQAEAAGEAPLALIARITAALGRDPGDEELAQRRARLVAQRASLAAAWLSAGDTERARRELDALRSLAPDQSAVIALEAALLDAERDAAARNDQE